MNLTFKGFLKAYCRELSGLETSNLRKLLSATQNDSPRAAEPLILYALAQGKLCYLASLSNVPWIQSLCKEASDVLGLSMPTNDADLAAVFNALPNDSRFKKVWIAYQAKKHSIANERRIAKLMRDKTIAALQTSGITPYKLCKDLGLNMGNVYAYLNKSDTSKVSLETARRIMKYALQS